MGQRPLDLGRAIAAEREQHRRVGLQFHAEAQAVDEDAGDMRPLLLARGLLLDDRGEGHRLLRAGERQVRSPFLPQLGQGMGHRPAHPLDQLLAGVAIAVDIGVGQEFALGRGRPGIAVEHRRVAQQGHDLGASQAFGDRQPVLDGLAAGDDVQGLQHADPGREFVFPGLQRAAARRQPGDQLKHQPVADDALAGQQIGDAADAGMRRHDQGARLAQRARALGLAVEPIAGAAEHRDDDPGGDQAPGNSAEKGDHAGTAVRFSLLSCTAARSVTAWASQ